MKRMLVRIMCWVAISATTVAGGPLPREIGMLASQGVDQCLACHATLGDKPAELFEKDVHRKAGIRCADCHGGNANLEDMEEAKSPKAGFIGVPRGDDITAVCAKCHSDQAEQLRLSVHGKLAVSGKEMMLQCTTCHQAHGILPVSNRASPVHPLNVIKTCGTCHSNASFMRTYNPALPVDQVEKYRTSEHGILHAKGDAKVAECASCHGSHDVRPAKDVRSKVHPTNLPQTCAVCHSDPEYMKGYKIPTDQLEKFARSVHGIALLEKRDFAAPACNDCHGNHGAAPPGVESISKVCGTCHAFSAELFSESPHKKAFDERKLPECETCHGNHEIIAATDKLLGVTPEAVCSRCHTEDDRSKGFAVARTMRALIDSLDGNEQRAIALVAEAEQKGMEIGEAKFRLREIRQARLESRTMVHSFDEDRFREVVGKGLGVASFVLGEAAAAIDEYYFRRWGLGISTLIITVLAVSLWLFIRRIERSQNRSADERKQLIHKL